MEFEQKAPKWRIPHSPTCEELSRVSDSSVGCEHAGARKEGEGGARADSLASVSRAAHTLSFIPTPHPGRPVSWSQKVGLGSGGIRQSSDQPLP